MDEVIASVLPTTTYRADHVGSLLRPPELLHARQEQATGRLPLEDLRRLEDDSILDCLAMQRATGVSVLSDGEYRRSSWMEAWERVLAPYEVADTAAPASIPMSDAGAVEAQIWWTSKRGRWARASSSANFWSWSASTR